METTVTLDCKDLNVTRQTFGIRHAEALLQLQAQRNIAHWQLTPGTGYIFDNGVITYTGKRKNKKPTEPQGGPGGV